MFVLIYWQDTFKEIFCIKSVKMQKNTNSKCLKKKFLFRLVEKYGYDLH
jgi:hypothetical protein